MKFLSDLTRKTLITPAEVVKVIGKAAGIDNTLFRNNIIIAEERFVRAFLGFDFYKSLVDRKTIEITSSNKDTLQTAIREDWPQANITLKIGDFVSDESALTADDRTLWRQYLWQLAAECVYFVSFPENYTAFTSSGIVHGNPKMDSISGNGKDGYTPELSTIKFQLDKINEGRIRPLADAMHEFLCKNIAKYPMYKQDCNCNKNGITGAGPTFINIYGDDECEDQC